MAAAFFPAMAPGQATDLVDTHRLGDRGVVFETVGLGTSALDSGVGIGDFNGDGFDDVALSSREGEPPDRFSYPENLSVIFGRPEYTERHTLDGSLSNALVLRLENIKETAMGTITLIPAGDLNGDGLADVLISMSDYKVEPNYAPGVVVLLNGTRGLDGAGFIEEIGEGIDGAVFYSSDSLFTLLGDGGAAPLDDFNGDGAADLALMGYFDKDPTRRKFAPAVTLLLALKDLPNRVDLSTPTVQQHSLRIVGFPPTYTGGVADAGDFNGDGLSDLLYSDRDRVFLIYGRRDSPPVLDLEAIEALEGEAGWARHGIAVFEGPSLKHQLDFGAGGQATSIGDMNGDGLSDILLGAAYSGVTFPGSPEEDSAAYIIYGKARFPSVTRLPSPPPGQVTTIRPVNGGFVGDGFGRFVAPAGDWNRDGVPDILLSAPHASPGGVARAGEAYLLFGKRDFGDEISLSNGFAGMRVIGEQTSGLLGWILSSAGDFNGDGALDLLVGARAIFFDPYPGRAYVIYGSGSSSPPFTLIGIKPVSGPQRGGTRVLIRGSGFEGTPHVSFGNLPGLAVRLLSGSELEVISPPADATGEVAVSVQVAGQARLLRDSFEYVPNLPEILLGHIGTRGVRIEGVSGNEIGHSLDFGDVTGDGVADLIIGSERKDGALMIGILKGGKALPEALPGFEASSRLTIITAPDRLDYNGVKIAVVGDVNGDAISDFAFAGTSSLGYLVFGRVDFPQEVDIDSLVAEGKASRVQPDSALGNYYSFSFAPIGDLTGDGLSDFAVALANDLDLGPGRIAFIQGRGEWPEIVDPLSSGDGFAVLDGNVLGFGEEVASPGDVNGDGNLDLYVSIAASQQSVESYLLYLEPGMPARISLGAFLEQGGGVVISRSDRQGAFLPFPHVAAPGDVDGDAFADLLFGDETGGLNNQGISFLVRGGPDLPSHLQLSDVAANGDQTTLILGSSEMVQSGRGIGPAGDWNGDGFSDYLVAEQNRHPFSAGNMYVVFGGASLPQKIQLSRPGRNAFQIAGIHDITRLEVSARHAGDLNADGILDFAFSEWGSQNFPSSDGIPSPGAVYVVFGLPARVPFLRGDATYDGRIDVSDAVFVLSYLFLGGEPPRCGDAADVDDDGQLSLTDAISILGALFLGGATPPPPFPDRGEDPTEDPLGCLGF